MIRPRARLAGRSTIASSVAEPLTTHLAHAPGRPLDDRSTRPIQHGGNQSAIRARLRLGDRPLIDFSAPLNGFGPPPGAIAAVRDAVPMIDRYPEPGAPRLVDRLAGRHGVPPECILVGAGTTELIGLVGQAMAGRPDPVAHLSEPTYGEYRRTCAQIGCRVEPINDHILGWDQEVGPEGDVGVFWTGHPNNPTGRAWRRDDLLALMDRSPGLLTVVDEAYLPFLPDEAERTLVGHAAARDDLIVLRSMTKVYGFPGLRIGYAVGPAEAMAQLRRAQPPWSVATAAEHAAIAALDDDDYLRRTIDLIGVEAARLTDRLWEIPGLRPAWPARERPADAASLPNFVLVSLVDTPWTSIQAQEGLARRGFFARECSNYRGLEVDSTITGFGVEVETRGHLRFSVRTPDENDLLLIALAEVMASGPGASA